MRCSQRQAGKETGVPQIEVTPEMIEADASPLDLGSDQDIDATLERGVAVLHASGRLLFEDEELDRALVLSILDAVFPLSPSS